MCLLRMRRDAMMTATDLHPVPAGRGNSR
jgi:hypothetical protein